MAVPTISGVSPSTGATFGRPVVVVRGTGFRLPPDPPDSGTVGGDVPATVLVLFGAVAAGDVRVWSSTVMSCRAPVFSGDAARDSDGDLVDPLPATVAVTVKNLNDAGVPISGEVAVRAGAFTYQRAAPRAQPGAVKLAIRALILFLRRHVAQEVAVYTHTDYDDSVGDALNIAHLARLPGVALTEIRVQRDRRATTEHAPAGASPDVAFSWGRRRAPQVVDLIVSAVGAAASMDELLDLGDALLRVLREEPWLEVKDQSGAALAILPLEPVGDLAFGNKAPESNLVAFRGQVAVRGLLLESDSFTEVGTFVDRTVLEAENLG